MKAKRESSIGVKFKITLSQEEIEILREYADLQGRPMASVFMEFLRDANVFSVLKKVNLAGRKIKKLNSDVQKIKSDFKSESVDFASI